MRPLAALERFFERLFERQTARLFRTKLQPIQLQRRLERAMESDRTREGQRTLVPNRFAIHLAPLDLEALREAHPTLAADLADSALGFARSHNYTLAGRPTVGLVGDTGTQPGDVRVEATTDGAGAARRSRAESGGMAGTPGEHASGGSDAAADDGPPAIERTAVFVIPTVSSPQATLREVRPDGTTRSFVVDGRPLTIGRGSDNGLVVSDTRASRHHARLYGRSGVLLFADLGSTNGSWVNDRRVEEIALGEGDRIRIGDTILIVEKVEEA